MPTPVGHALGGVISVALFKNNGRAKWFMFALVLFFAELPDIDFLFGLFKDDANKYHHQFTHSVSFILIVALIGAQIVSKFDIMQFSKSFVLFTIAGATHLIFDLLALDTSEPYGAQVFWPFWNGYVISPVTIFSDVHRSATATAFLPSLFSIHNLITVFIEFFILAPIGLAVWVGKKYKEKKA